MQTFLSLYVAVFGTDNVLFHILLYIFLTRRAEPNSIYVFHTFSKHSMMMIADAQAAVEGERLSFFCKNSPRALGNERGQPGKTRDRDSSDNRRGRSDFQAAFVGNLRQAGVRYSSEGI